MKKIMIALPLAAALAACGSGGSEGGAAKQSLKVVGSSTVYPFTTAVAEQFQRDNPNVSVVVGLVVGAIAQATIDEAVRVQMERELEAAEPARR